MSRSITRRQVIRAACATALAMNTLRLRAQPRVDATRVLCGYPAGGLVDIVARRLAERLGKSFARSAIVENRPGAAGRLAVDVVKAAVPDGSALLVTPGSVLTMYPHIYRPISYDVFSDLAPVAMVASTEFCLAVGPRCRPPCRASPTSRPGAALIRRKPTVATPALGRSRISWRC